MCLISPCQCQFAPFFALGLLSFCPPRYRGCPKYGVLVVEVQGVGGGMCSASLFLGGLGPDVVVVYGFPSASVVGISSKMFGTAAV